MPSNKIDISIVVISYNQENFIVKCIESILSQEFDGSIELLIGDDCSTDKTSQKIRNAVSGLSFKVYFEQRDVNVGPSANLADLIQRAQGKYVCILEGDDFWTSNRKLQLQYTFLEENHCFSACTHQYSIIDEKDGILSLTYTGKGAPSETIYKTNHFENYIYPGHLGTLMFRNFLGLEELKAIAKLDRYIGDISLYGFLVYKNPIFVLNENYTSVRLIKNKRGTNYKSLIKGKSQNSKRIIYLEKLKKSIESVYGIRINFKERKVSYFVWSLLFTLRFPSRHNAADLLYCMQYLLTGRIKFRDFEE